MPSLTLLRSCATSRPVPPLSASRLSLPDGRLLPSPLTIAREYHKRGLPGLTLSEFVSAAWHVVEPSTPLVWGWHLDALCAHVQAVLEGRERKGPWTQNLLINIPPGTMKSLVVSVFAPAWVWLWRPSWRAIFTSANPRVSLRDSVRCRDLLESDWYRKTFAAKWTMAEDQNAKGNFKNSEGGFRLAISVGSKVTGDRAHALFVDDPLDAADAPSKLAREAVTFWWDQALANRLADLQTDTRIVIMQRLHEEDLSGHLLAQGGWEHLCLPMEFEVGAKKKTFLGWSDPRKKEGELLFSERFPESVLAVERKRMGSAGYAGQMQQRPAPTSGNKFQRTWWRFWSATGETLPRPRGCSAAPPKKLNLIKPQFAEIIGSWDCAFKDTDGSDYVVGLTIGRIGADRYVLARFRDRVGFADTVRAIRQQRLDWPTVDAILVEDKANGSAVIETLSAELTGIVAVNPSGGKEARAATLEPEVEAGNWYLPEGAEWLEEWVEEFATFPRGRHDDQVDACSQASLRLRGDSDELAARALLGMRP